MKVATSENLEKLEKLSHINNYPERIFLGRFLKSLFPPSRLSTKDWAEKNRVLTSEVSSRVGRMDCMVTPWMIYVMECLDNPKVKVIVGKKSAQIAWTETINNFIGRTVDLDPRNIMVAFPRAKSAQKFFKEKLKPFIINTPCLNNKIKGLSKMSHNHISYDGGFLILANLGSADDGKSSVIPIIIVEEPDGIKADVNKQGDGMSILIQRMKSFTDGKLIYAGTPTDFSFSQVDRAYESSNKMQYMVPCHECNDFHSLDFSNLKYDIYLDGTIHKLYGKYNPESAYYVCPHCKVEWSFAQKNKNVLEGLKYFNKGWEVTNPKETIVYGFAFNELLSSFETSNFINLGKQYLRAKKAYDSGNEGLMKSFTNNSKGEAYKPLQTGHNLEQLKALRSSYIEGVIQYQGLILTAGIDVQHNRFAIVIRAWGRNGNSWLVHWKEIFGNVLDGDDPVWSRLAEHVFKKWPHASGKGRFLQTSAVTIDCADGTTAGLVYDWVLEHNTEYCHVFAGKGIASKNSRLSYEIFNEPSSMEVNTFVQTRRSLAETRGVAIYSIGAHVAHAEVLRRFNVKGRRDRHYHCATEYGKYEEGILSCVKNYQTDTRVVSFEKKPGADKEAIDCEKMALHAAYAIQIRNYTESRFREIETYLTTLDIS